ncbi:hypothetical protein Tco_0870873 [Tanacetum coccineum]
MPCCIILCKSPHGKALGGLGLSFSLGNCGNQFRQYAGQNAGNQIGYNVGNHNGYNVVQNAENQVANQNGNGNVVATWAKEIREANANSILMANLQQTSTSGTHADNALVFDLDGSGEDDSNVIHVDSNMNLIGGEVEHRPATIEETRAFFDSLYYNLVIESEKVNMVNHETKEANVKLTTKLARYKGRQKSFEINQAKFGELENGY